MNATKQTDNVLLFEQYRDRYIFLVSKQTKLIDERDELHQKIILAIQTGDSVLYNQIYEQNNSISKTLLDMENEIDETYEKLHELHDLHQQYVAQTETNN